MSETCGTCARFARDTETDDSGACFDLIYRISPGEWGYAMVAASSKACGDWTARRMPKAMCDTAHKQHDGLCLGYGTGIDDEPCDTCKQCTKSTIYGME